VAAGVLVFAPAALASGPTYCVGEPVCPGGTSLSTEENGNALQEALKEAGKHPESTVLIGPGEYSHDGGFTYEGGPVTIRGAGDVRTFLTDDGKEGETVLKVKPTPGDVATVSGLAVREPRTHEGGIGEKQLGLELQQGARTELVNVEGGGGKEDTGALIWPGSSYTLGAILLSPTEGTTGVAALGGEISRCVVIDVTGVRALGPQTTTVRGCVIGASKVGLEALAAPLLAEDSLVYAGEGGGTGKGVLVHAEGNGHAATATLRGLTVVGGSRGVVVEANTTTGTATASALVESSVFAETTENSLRAVSSAPTGAKAKAVLQVAYSDFFGGHEAGNVGEGAEAVDEEREGDLETPPHFVKGLTGSEGLFEGAYVPAPGSPLIDAGVPGPLAPGESEEDLEGNPRIVHGRRDIGAYEVQFRPPTVSASASPTTAQTGQSVSFTGSATTVEPGDSVASYQWTFDDGATVPAGASASHAFATPGLHTATLTVADLLGVQASATVQVQVAAAPAPPPPPPPCKTCAVAGPSIASLAVTPSRFHALRTGATVAPKSTGGGAVVAFTLTKKGGVTFTVERLLPGVLHGRSCVASHHLHRCTRTVRYRSFTRDGRAGSNAFRFSGRLNGHTLPPGRYILLATLADGSASSAPFTILR